ncbi:MAG: AMP-binding protein [Alphaproteobacteria bacterium]|nr:AMP-binding protein [Alphaproteobacteria bacterium]
MQPKSQSHLLDPLFATRFFDSNHLLLCENGIELNYASLKQKVQSLAATLRAANMKPQDRVAVALPRGIDAAIAIYAILYEGGIYVPLDIKNPSSRISYIIKDAGIKIVLGRYEKAEWCSDDIKWIDTSYESKDSIEVGKGRNFGGENLAAILYTSGSTGTPKGVALSHRAMCAFSDWAGNIFKISNKDKIASLSPFYFDLSIFDLFTTLRYSGCVNFIPSQLTISPSKMALWLADNEITAWYTVPSLLIFLASKGNLSNIPLSTLRIILFAGEVFPNHQLLKLLELLPHVKFYNLYGPTETNVCSFWPVDSKRVRSMCSIPIGFPACENQLKIDPVTKELLVSGPTLMSGYWQHENVVKNIFEEEKWYRTGDMVSINQRGEFLFNGRLDRMAKISGHRIEPLEVEKVIYSFPGIKENVVMGIRDEEKRMQLAACIVAGPKIDKLAFKKFLNQSLPLYMQPTSIVWIKSIPRLGNGKIDYQTISQLVMRRK